MHTLGRHSPHTPSLTGSDTTPLKRRQGKQHLHCYKQWPSCILKSFASSSTDRGEPSSSMLAPSRLRVSLDTAAVSSIQSKLQGRGLRCFSFPPILPQISLSFLAPGKTLRNTWTVVRVFLKPVFAWGWARIQILDKEDMSGTEQRHWQNLLLEVKNHSEFHILSSIKHPDSYQVPTCEPGTWDQGGPKQYFSSANTCH